MSSSASVSINVTPCVRNGRADLSVLEPIAWRAGLVPSDDAWRRLKLFRSVDAPVIRYLSHDEIARLLNACHGAFRDLVHAALLTGRRYGELCRPKVVDYSRGVETLTIREAKSGRVRHVTLTGEGAGAN